MPYSRPYIDGKEGGGDDDDDIGLMNPAFAECSENAPKKNTLAIPRTLGRGIEN